MCSEILKKINSKQMRIEFLRYVNVRSASPFGNNNKIFEYKLAAASSYYRKQEKQNLFTLFQKSKL